MDNNKMNTDESKTHFQSVINNNSPDINLEDYKKKIDQISPDKISINDQSITPPSNATSELTQSDNTKIDAASSNIQVFKPPVQDDCLNEDDNDNNRQRKVSSSSSTSSSLSDNETSNIPYEILNNDDDDDDDDLSEPAKETINKILS